MNTNFIPVTLKRLGPGYYVTSDKKYEIISIKVEESNGYRTAGEVYWVFYRVGGEANDTFATKWEAKQALEEYLWAEANDPQ